MAESRTMAESRIAAAGHFRTESFITAEEGMLKKERVRLFLCRQDEIKLILCSDRPYVALPESRQEN